jgi:hypothetical protein
MLWSGGAWAVYSVLTILAVVWVVAVMAGVIFERMRRSRSQSHTEQDLLHEHRAAA